MSHIQSWIKYFGSYNSIYILDFFLFILKSVEVEIPWQFYVESLRSQKQEKELIRSIECFSKAIAYYPYCVDCNSYSKLIFGRLTPVFILAVTTVPFRFWITKFRLIKAHWNVIRWE